VFERVEPADFRAGEPERATASVLALTDGALTHVERLGAQLAVACLALRGLVDRLTGPQRAAPNRAWRHVDELAVVGDHPVAAHELWLATGASLAARAEAPARADTGSFLYVSGEVGVGGAIVLDGEVFAGAHGWSGELGHMILHAD